MRGVARWNGREVGQHELDALEIDDAPVGKTAIIDVADRRVERRPRDAERMGGDARP